MIFKAIWLRLPDISTVLSQIFFTSMYPNKSWLLNTQLLYQHLSDNIFFATKENIQFYIKNGSDHDIQINMFDSSHLKLDNETLYKLIDTADEFLLYENNTIAKISETYQFIIGMSNVSKQNMDKCKDLLNLLQGLIGGFIEQAIQKGPSNIA